MAVFDLIPLIALDFLPRHCGHCDSDASALSPQGRIPSESQHLKRCAIKSVWVRLLVAKERANEAAYESCVRVRSRAAFQAVRCFFFFFETFH